MGAIELCPSPYLCFIKTTKNSRRPGWAVEGNNKRVVSMASTIPVEQQVNGGQQRLTGDSFIRPHLRKLSPYQPILPFEVLSTRLGRKPEDIIKLDANENPYGPPPEVFEALGALKFPYVYPDPESRRLRAALAEDSGLETDYILAGCGADELIDLIMRSVLDPGDKIVDCPPTFTMYEFDAAVNGALVIKVPRNSDFSLNVELIKDAVEREKPKCIFLTSPNNPDGSIINDETLLKILELPILVVLDEAYVEFSGIESRMQWVKKHENLIVLRTFSKRAGLAGLRVGYGAFPLSLIEYLWRAKQPYNVSVAAEVAACAALQNPTYLEKVKDALLQERKRLFGLLKDVPFLNPYPSYSNFILCEVTSGVDAKKLKEDLAKMGVMIRHYNNKELRGYVRVSVGKPEHTDALMKGLRSLF
ncbi:histidinol-phosphate aminotransferase, chloroplastic-like [Ziziphus jujuba]|uniref:histidinol-phosphate transaminase n=1 Tax=Ziziphus jujuba TaxID=326968 RepID=A0ABM3IF25_ZIZJJ|nr:histidinol-phosphate aminotransferase, chloroplastic-like [Ziziphus jujuba]